MYTKDRLPEVLRQYQEGAITYCEFVNFALCCVTDEDRAEYPEVYHKERCPY